MASLFEDYANAVLHIPTYTGEGYEDPGTGNWIEGRSSTQETQAWLKSRTSAQTRISAGLDTSLVYLQGYLVDPPDFPDGFNPPAQVPLTLGKREGIFSLVVSTDSGTGGLKEDALGQWVEGEFRVHGGA